MRGCTAWDAAYLPHVPVHIVAGRAWGGEGGGAPLEAGMPPPACAPRGNARGGDGRGACKAHRRRRRCGDEGSEEGAEKGTIAARGGRGRMGRSQQRCRECMAHARSAWRRPSRKWAGKLKRCCDCIPCMQWAAQCDPPRDPFDAPRFAPLSLPSLHVRAAFFQAYQVPLTRPLCPRAPPLTPLPSLPPPCRCVLPSSRPAAVPMPPSPSLPLLFPAGACRFLPGLQWG